MTQQRTALCLACRTTLAEGERCDLGCQSGTLSMANAQQRELLINGAWDNGLVRFSAVKAPVDYRALKLPAYLSVGGGILAAMGVVGGTVSGVFVVAPWLLVPVLAGRSTRKLFSGVRAPGGGKDSMHQGVVLSTDPLAAPASGRQCLAYSIRLRHRETESDTLVDAFSSGFDVKLADGRVAHIPAGRIRLEGDKNLQTLPATVEMSGWWQQIDPLHHPGERMPPYPHNQIQEVVLEAGQTILLQNELLMTTRQHRGADYRDASANVLEPRGVPFLKFL